MNHPNASGGLHKILVFSFLATLMLVVSCQLLVAHHN
jgi:hypothetical protein